MYLFVYGTLRKSSYHEAHKLLELDCIYQSDGYFYGDLFNLGEYPIAIQNDNTSNKVLGELYRIINAKPLFERLDDYEECSVNYPNPHDYKRLKIRVYDTHHQSFSAWCYLSN